MRVTRFFRFTLNHEVELWEGKERGLQSAPGNPGSTRTAPGASGKETAPGSAGIPAGVFMLARPPRAPHRGRGPDAAARRRRRRHRHTAGAGSPPRHGIRTAADRALPRRVTGGDRAREPARRGGEWRG